MEEDRNDDECEKAENATDDLMMIYMITGDGRGRSRTAHDMIIYDDINHGMI